ncbi:MAG: hypothetical protein JXR40_03115, partial [Pontiellaceae bacterium]|nr:hypothetical protein [Pontiellaceae bacterium]
AFATILAHHAYLRSLMHEKSSGAGGGTEVTITLIDHKPQPKITKYSSLSSYDEICGCCSDLS